MKCHHRIPTYLEHVVVRWEVDLHDRAVAILTTQGAGIQFLHRHALGVRRVAVAGPLPAAPTRSRLQVAGRLSDPCVLASVVVESGPQRLSTSRKNGLPTHVVPIEQGCTESDMML